MVPELYIEYLKTHDARPLAGVFYHNEIDILSLAALLNLLAKMLNNPSESNTAHSLDLIAIARLYEELGYLEKAITAIRRQYCSRTTVKFFGRNA